MKREGSSDEILLQFVTCEAVGLRASPDHAPPALWRLCSVRASRVARRGPCSHPAGGPDAAFCSSFELEKGRSLASIAAHAACCSRGLEPSP